MLLVYMTCTETSGSGVRIGTGIIQSTTWLIRKGRTRADAELFVAVRGTTFRITAARHIDVGTCLKCTRLLRFPLVLSSRLSFRAGTPYKALYALSPPSLVDGLVVPALAGNSA